MFATVTLPDGRTLEYADLGDPAGRPVLYFHGTPGTAGGGAIVAEAARRHGVRLLATSRPGYGASTTSAPGLASVAADSVDLADQLGLGQFLAMGTSGGGPYALAVGAVAPGRVTSVAVLGGVGDLSEVDPDALDEDDRRAIGLMAAGDVEGASAFLAGCSEAAFGPMRGLSADDFHLELEKRRPPGENWFDSHPDLLHLFEADWQRAFTTFDGFVRDNLSWVGAWDVELTAVTTPVRLVYGEGDQMVPRAHGEWLHQRLPSSELHVVPGGHGHATFGAAMDAFALSDEPSA
jgi:pimeloyl-ACP methyl ester carboxylesterase